MGNKPLPVLAFRIAPSRNSIADMVLLLILFVAPTSTGKLTSAPHLVAKYFSANEVKRAWQAFRPV
jgi:hypothetical protein